MAIFCDLTILALATLLSFIRSGLLPLEELEELVMPYAGILFWGMIAFFVLKYAVYEIFMFRDIRYINAADNDMPKSSYIVLAAYPLCDILRLLMLLGIVSGIFHNLVPEYGTFSTAITYIVLVVLLVAMFFIDYFSKDAEGVLAHVIPTLIFAALVVTFSKGMVLEGLKLL